MAMLRDLTTEQSVSLIAPDGVGRLALCTARGADIFPLNYVVDGASLVFRTTPYGVLGTYEWGQRPVAFEVDFLDFEAREGWSVVARGVAEPIGDPGEVEAIASTKDPTPWAGGMRRLYVRLTWDEITGRHIGEEALPQFSEPMAERWHHIGPWSHG